MTETNETQNETQNNESASQPQKSKLGIILIVLMLLGAVVFLVFMFLDKKEDLPSLPNSNNNLDPATLPTNATSTQTVGATQPTQTVGATQPTQTVGTIRPTQTNTTTNLVGCQQNWTYKEGKGGYVEDLQRFLNETQNAKLATDGVYGAKTDSAVVAWTKATGKTPSDIACATWEWKVKSNNIATGTFSSNYNSQKAEADAQKLFGILRYQTFNKDDSTLLLFVGRNKYDVDVMKYHYNKIKLSNGTNPNMVVDLKNKLSTSAYNKISSLL